MFDGVKIRTHDRIPRQMHALYRDGNPVWYGPIGSPIEDAVFDTIMVHPDDYNEIGVKISLAQRRMKGK